MTDKQLGLIEAYKDMERYATSMIIQSSDPKPWADMAFYAHTSIEDIIDPVDIEDVSAVEF